MSRFLVLLAAAGALIAAASMHGPIPMRPHAVSYEMAADSIVVPVTLADGRIEIQVRIDGRGPFPFLFDTGAQGSVMDLEFARGQGFALGQEVMVGSPGGKGRPGRMATLDRLEIGGLTLKGLTCVAFDGLPFPRTATSPRGVLGPYALSGLLITLDYPGKRIVFRRGELPEPDGREIFGWTPGQRLPEIPIQLGGESLLVHLDSGAARGLSVPTALADRLPLDGPIVDMGFAKTVDRVLAVRGARVRGTLNIGRFSMENPLVRFSDVTLNVGNMGGGILGSLAITIDPARARLRLTGPTDGMLTLLGDEKPHYGMQLSALDANPPEVLVVDSASPAETAGLRAGDRLIRLNARPIEKLTVDERVEALKASPLRVTVLRGGKSLELALSFP